VGSFALPVRLHVLALVVDPEATNQALGTSIQRLVATAAVTVYDVTVWVSLHVYQCNTR
jgi:hypothetical protein